MNRVSETIMLMLNKGQDIFEVSKFFGGINELLQITKKYPYLQAIIQSKLGGVIHCSAEGKDEVMIPFSLNFNINDLEFVSEDDFEHMNAYVDVIIPELTQSDDMQNLFSWLNDYLSDLGMDVGQFEDSKLNYKMVWVNVSSINGIEFVSEVNQVSDLEVLELIPSKYKEP